MTPKQGEGRASKRQLVLFVVLAAVPHPQFNKQLLSQLVLMVLVSTHL